MNKLTLIAMSSGLIFSGACATNTAIDERIAASEARTDAKIETVGAQVEELQEAQRRTDARLDELSREASEALTRATEAGILAQGKVVFEESFTEDRIRFALNSSQLSNDATASLDTLAQRIKALDRPVWIEIQGHTDSTGAESYNEDLGLDRAEAVRRYLSRTHDIPLARMSTISYGESSPAASNANREGRSQNRRVVVVVLE
ncbi:MAG: OmpA family protein [Acidobacteria bacterium]|nr:OmpA family protein [Acidobacteriota bacterium]